MAINFESALGIHDRALSLHSRRAEVLANNIANADTPGYQARDLDFAKLLQSSTQERVRMKTTHARHLPVMGAGTGGAELLYRVPMQPSLDGNTVDLQIEQAEYAKNALKFQTSFTFLNSKFKGLSKALRGE